jgi:hypothetical protein
MNKGDIKIRGKRIPAFLRLIVVFLHGVRPHGSGFPVSAQTWRVIAHAWMTALGKICHKNEF